MKVNTTDFATEGGIINLNASILNFGGGPFPFIQGKVKPELGTGIDVTNVFVSTIIRQNGVYYKGQGFGTGMWPENNYINWSSQAPIGFLEFAEGLTLHWYIQVDFIQNGETRSHSWDVGGISLAPPAVPTINLSAELDPMSEKVIHRINIAASYNANGATILQRKIWVDGVQVSVSGTNPFTAVATKSDATPPITYNILAEVQYQTTLFGIVTTGWVSASAQVTYYGEFLEE